MGKKASLSETKRAKIVILHRKGFLKGRFAKKCPVAKRLFIKHLLDLKILDFTMTRKGMESHEKQALMIQLDLVNSCLVSNWFLQENTHGTA